MRQCQRDTLGGCDKSRHGKSTTRQYGIPLASRVFSVLNAPVVEAVAVGERRAQEAWTLDLNTTSCGTIGYGHHASWRLLGVTLPIPVRPRNNQ